MKITDIKDPKFLKNIVLENLMIYAKIYVPLC